MALGCGDQRFAGTVVSTPVGLFLASACPNVMNSMRVTYPVTVVSTGVCPVMTWMGSRMAAT